MVLHAKYKNASGVVVELNDVFGSECFVKIKEDYVHMKLSSFHAMFKLVC